VERDENVYCRIGLIEMEEEDANKLQGEEEKLLTIRINNIEEDRFVQTEQQTNRSKSKRKATDELEKEENKRLASENSQPEEKIESTESTSSQFQAQTQQTSLPNFQNK